MFSFLYLYSFLFFLCLSLFTCILIALTGRAVQGFQFIPIGSVFCWFSFFGLALIWCAKNLSYVYLYNYVSKYMVLLSRLYNLFVSLFIFIHSSVDMCQIYGVLGKKTLRYLKKKTISSYIIKSYLSCMASYWNFYSLTNSDWDIYLQSVDCFDRRLIK